MKKLICFFRGHPCVPTGRVAIILVEWRCSRCGGLYVSHSEYPGALVAADHESDRIFRDYADAIKAVDALPR